MARLELSFLGPFQVRLGSQPVTGFEADKVRLLLAYLAVESSRPTAVSSWRLCSGPAKLYEQKKAYEKAIGCACKRLELQPWQEGTLDRRDRADQLGMFGSGSAGRPRPGRCGAILAARFLNALVPIIAFSSV